MNKRILAAGFAGLLALSMAGCGSSEPADGSPADGSAQAATSADEAATQVVSYGGVSIEVPGAWRVADADDGKYAYPDYGGLVYLNVQDVGPIQSTPDEVYAEYVSGLTEGGEFTVEGPVDTGAVGEAVSYRVGLAVQVDDAHLTGEMETVLSEGKLCSVMFAIPDDAFGQHAADIAPVLDSIELDNPAAPVVASDQGPAQEAEAAEQDADEAAPSAPAERQLDAIITVENNEEFAHLLTVAGPGVPEVGEFAERYAGRTIAFDGVVTAYAPHGSYNTRFDFLINVGDDPETATKGPNFRFDDVNYYDFHWVGDGPDEVLVGTKIHVVARIDRYESTPELFYLDPVETTVRE